MATSETQETETATLDASGDGADNEASAGGLNTDNLGTSFPPTAAVKEIRNKEIHITGRNSTKVPFDQARDGKYGKPDENGMKTLCTITTKETFTVPVKKEETEGVNTFYVSEGHYKQLDKLHPKGAAAVDAEFAKGAEVGPLIAAKVQGQKNIYWAWLTPEKYADGVEDGTVLVEG